MYFFFKFYVFFSFTVVRQFFESQVYDEYVIKGNAAIFKCQTPSFVADHLEVTDWLDTEGGVYTKNETGISINNFF